MNSISGPDTAIATSAPDPRIDLYREEIKALESLERWGGSLFLAAIALIAKQIIDWSIVPPGGAPPLALHWLLHTLPALVGLTAFVFLRSVNFRIRGVRDKLYRLMPADNSGAAASFGSVGWWMALMPLLFGYGASGYLSLYQPEAQLPVLFLIAIAVAVVGNALVAFVCSNQTRKTPSPTS